MDFRSCILKEQSKEIVEQPTNPYLEVSQKILAVEPYPILFHHVSGMKLATNFFCSRQNYAQHLNLPLTNFLQTLSDHLTHNPTSVEKHATIYGEVEWQEVDLRKLPILTHYQGDGGPYITAGVWIVNDPIFGINLSYHRMMILNETQASVRVVENRGMHQALTHSGGKAEVAICIGASPAVLLAAACSPAIDVNELELAARLDQIKLVRCKTVRLDVPADCEIVLEGHFTGELADEGPFVDITGTWDYVRQQPIVEITRIAHRKNPIYHALVPGKAEHRILMGMPKEIDIFNEVNKTCRCLDVRMTAGGCAWLHAVIQIQKQTPDDGELALAAAFRSHKSLKHCVVVDDDIDIDDPNKVEWAIATRFQAEQNLIVFTDQPSSSLDPSATHIAGKKSRGSKMGLDATIKKFGAEAKLFKKVE